MTTVTGNGIAALAPFIAIFFIYLFAKVDFFLQDGGPKLLFRKCRHGITKLFRKPLHHRGVHPALSRTGRNPAQRAPGGGSNWIPATQQSAQPGTASWQTGQDTFLHIVVTLRSSPFVGHGGLDDVTGIVQATEFVEVVGTEDKRHL